MAEFPVGLFVRQMQRPEDVALQLRVGDPDGAARELDAVEHQVKGFRIYPGGITVQVGDALVERRGEGMMHGDPFTELLIPLEEGDLRDPEQIVPFPGDLQAVGHLQPQGAQNRLHGLFHRSGDDQHHVPGLGPGRPQQGGHLVFGKEFAEGGGRSLRRPADPGEAFRADPPYVFGQFVDFLAGQDGRRSLGGDAAHCAAA